MSGFFHLPPGVGGFLAWARKAVYGPGYRRARRAAFRRSHGMCQLCGLFPAEEAHHWAWRYPTDAKITADHLIALCLRCHWAVTLLRVTGRMLAGVWFILAMATPPVRGRKRVARRQPRACPDSERPTTSRRATGAPEPDLHALIVRCHLELVVGCLACERYVRLDTVLSLRPRWQSMSLAQLRRRLCCCRCRSRTRWVLLGGWPPAGAVRSEGRPARDGVARAGYGPDHAGAASDGSSRDAGSRRAMRRRGEGATAGAAERDAAVTAPRPAGRGVAVAPAQPDRRAAVAHGGRGQCVKRQGEEDER